MRGFNPVSKTKGDLGKISIDKELRNTIQMCGAALPRMQVEGKRCPDCATINTLTSGK